MPRLFIAVAGSARCVAPLLKQLSGLLVTAQARLQRLKLVGGSLVRKKSLRWLLATQRSPFQLIRETREPVLKFAYGLPDFLLLRHFEIKPLSTIAIVYSIFWAYLFSRYPWISLKPNRGIFGGISVRVNDFWGWETHALSYFSRGNGRRQKERTPNWMGARRTDFADELEISNLTDNFTCPSATRCLTTLPIRWRFTR